MEKITAAIQGKATINFTIITRLLIAAARIVLNVDDHAQFAQFVNGFVKHIKMIERNHGVEYVVKYAKAIQLHVTRYLSGHPLVVSSIRLGLTADGLPKVLGPFCLESIRSYHYGMIRMILSTVGFHRILLGTGELDASTIVNPPTWEPLGLQQVTEGVLGVLRAKYGGMTVQWTDPHLSTKSGPNGQALGTALIDYQCLPQSLKDAIVTLGGYHLKYYLSEMANLPEELKPPLPDVPLLRKVSVVKDRSMKNRVIAIFDYWSQTALMPVHKLFMDLLKDIHNDCTFEQGHERDLSIGMDHYSCFDLTAATDRFPLPLQEAVVGHLLGEEKANAWKHILVDYEFNTRGQEPIKYAAGQPMGAYSSWAVFAFTHHLVVQYAASLAGHVPWEFSRYALLGDDIVIYDPAVAIKYKEIMSILGVGISDPKTHQGNILNEFAKRVFINGVEVTPLPINAIIEDWNNPVSLGNLLLDLSKRGWFGVNSSTVPGHVVQAIVSVFTQEPRSISRLTRMTLEGLVVLRTARGDAETAIGHSYSQLVNNCPTTALRLPCVVPESFRMEITKVLVQEYMSLLAKAKQQCRTVMDRAIAKQVMFETELIDIASQSDYFVSLGLAQSLPWMLVMSNQNMEMERMYAQYMGKDVSEVPVEDIKTFLGAFRLSDPDRINSIRNAEVIKRQQSKVVSTIVRHISA